MPNPPHSPACERNKEPIAAVLREVFRDVTNVLEIGSGTGQHAVYFGAEMPHLRWQPSDRRENLSGIETWRYASKLANVLPAMELDVDAEPWPTACSHGYDAAFTANTLHIMSWPQVRRLFAGIGGLLTQGAPFVVYGPFNRGGQYTSESNREFDQFLKARDPASGIRDLQAVTELAQACGFALEAEHGMPANNLTLVLRKR